MDSTKLKGRILGIDRSDLILNTLKLPLEKEGYEVSTTIDININTLRASQILPELILLNADNSSKEALELCRKLKKSEMIKEIPVLFITGNEDKGYKLKIFDAGGVDYINPDDQLEEKISRIKTHVLLRITQLDLKEKNEKLENIISIRRIAEEEIREQNVELEKNLEVRSSELTQTARMLRIISECNHVLARAKTETELLKEVCKVIVDYGGYPLVQIAYSEPDDPNSFLIREQLSFNDELLQIVSTFWIDLKKVFLSAGEGISQGKPFLMRNIQADPRFSFWNESVVFDDNISFLALPLGINKVTFGALGIYTSRPDAFESEEVNLLLELANDFSYGIKNQREQIDKKKADESIRLNEKRLSTLLNLNEMRDASLHELAIYIMEHAVKLTDSDIGYIALGSEDGENLIMHAWSTKAMQQCQIIDKPIIYKISETGLWGEAVRQKKPVLTNNYEDYDPAKKGYPSGHVRIKKHLNVPLFEDNKIALLIGVGNKQTDYNESDIHQLELLNIGMWRVIQKRKADEELRQSEERWYRLIEYNPACIVIFSEERIIYSNASWLKIVKILNLSEIIDKPILNFINKEHIVEFENKIGQILSKDKPSEPFEIAIKKSDGENVYVETTIIPITFLGKRAIMQVSWDITERKNLVNELIWAKEKAEKANKLKSEFLAQVSHEIRSPLNVILSFNKLIQSEIEDQINDDLKDSFTSIGLAGKRIIRTVDLILNMAELQTGTYEALCKVVDLKNILERVKKQYHLSAEQKGLEFVFLCNSDATEINADLYSLEQIFTNLVDNAIKYTHKGKIEIVLDKNESGNLRVKISDTGIGISREYLNELFEPFSQEEQGYNRRFEGNGLGLALVQRYCTINNAVISVQSKKGEGTTFTVAFRSGR